MTSAASDAAVLTFDDEFNSLSLWNGTSGTWDTTAPYVPLNGNGYSLPTNGEQEWYINSTYAPTASVQPWSVSNGVLTLTAAPASAAIQPLIDGYQYTSGSINTSHSFSQTYGYFEMSAELPAGQGLWPAFWLLPESGAWPPEIDAMEVLGSDPTMLYTSVHSTDPTTGAEVNGGGAETVANTSTGFHTYGVDWEPDFITYFFDGVVVNEVATPPSLDQPMYMIANLAVGGAWPGSPNSTTPFPASMQIDYIRAYSALPASIAAEVVPVAAANFTLPSDMQDIQLVGTAPQTVIGNSEGDIIVANDSGSTITGGTGNDTIIAGHGADVLTGGGGSDTFVFNAIPWTAGQITDFNPATDTLDLSGIFASIGYSGTNPVADGYVTFTSDGKGNTLVYVNTHQANVAPQLITTLDHVSPSNLSVNDFSFQSWQSSGSPTPTEPSGPLDIALATYTLPSTVQNVQLTGTTAQVVTGNSLGDVIASNDYGSTITGGTGNDTIIAGHGADVLTGGGGSDNFVFNVLPWNAGQITDFNTATDKLDLAGIFTSIGYTGTNPVADGYLTFTSDGKGDTLVEVISHQASDPWPTLITTLDHVSPSSITAQDWVFNSSGSSSSGTGSTGGSGSTGGTPMSTTPVDTAAASYTVPSGVENVVLTGTSAQTVVGNSLGDTITSNDYGSHITGGTGNDTLIAGHGADILTGGGGSDTFVFNYLPWNAGQITDFNTATDKIDLAGIFTSIGYTGSNPVADGYLTFTSDGKGDTLVEVISHQASDPWPTLITTLDNVSPSSITAQDWVFSTSATSSTGTGSTGGTPVSTTPVDTAAALYTVPSGVENVVLTGTSAQTVVGNSLGDTITSNDDGSHITGGTGNDTLIAGHGADILTGGGGSDNFVFNYLPWNAGQITDFNTATDKIDLAGIFTSIGYTGTNPVADGYLTFTSDGKGDTLVEVISHQASDPWPTLITTLDNVSPASITAQDWTFQSPDIGTALTVTPIATASTTPVDTSAASYTVPTGVDVVDLTGTAAQTVIGNSLGDTITSNDFGSTITGGTGNDTLIAGHGADILTGGGGNDNFVFNVLPWNAGQITDFNTATDKLDLAGIFTSIGYTGSNPVADGYLTFTSDGKGDTLVEVISHQASDPWPTLITTLDHVSPSSITAQDWTFQSSAPAAPVNSTPIDTSAASYTVPNGYDNVVLTGTSAQTVVANSLGDTITSNDFGSTITGGTGNDTLIAGHGADILTGGGGNDNFVFNVLPWNAGQITDFNTATDKFDLAGIFTSIGYTGSNPVADGYLTFTSDGKGDTLVEVISHQASDPWPTLITTLDNVSPSSITAQDWTFQSSAPAAPVNSTPIDTSAASYTVPNGYDDVVLTGTSAQTVVGNSLGDTFTSNNFGSTITGGAGNDTFIAGQGADILTGGGGSDNFVFNNLPWNAGQITDFNTATDTLNLSGIFTSIGYTGTNPVADGYLTFTSDGKGDTLVEVNSHSASDPWPTLVTTLDHVSPSSITSHDWVFHA